MKSNRPQHDFRQNMNAIGLATGGQKQIGVGRKGTERPPIASKSASQIDLLDLIDRNNREQLAIGFALLRARQQRKLIETTVRERGAAK